MANITYGMLKRGGIIMLENAGIENPARDVRLLLEKASGKSAAELIISDRETVPEPVQVDFHEMLGFRVAHEPIAYIFGEKAFWSLDFHVDENVLIPRPETEGVVERALELAKNIRSPHILDIGTGSGAILISLLHERADATGCGLDISEAALKIAMHNAERLGVAGRCAFEQSNYLSEANNLCQTWGRFDIIVANPPYIDGEAMENLPPDVELYEPELALHGGVDGLTAYRSIIDHLADVLTPGGHIVFEIGFDQKIAVSTLLADAGASNIICKQDLAGHDRVISAAFC